MPSIGVIGGLAGVGGASSVAAAKASTKVSCMYMTPPRVPRDGYVVRR